MVQDIPTKCFALVISGIRQLTHSIVILVESITSSRLKFTTSNVSGNKGPAPNVLQI